MNANELADELFNYLPSCDAEKFANVLRQQQAEIEALKECIRQYELMFNLRKAQENG
jgi:hypothetical protein